MVPLIFRPLLSMNPLTSFTSMPPFVKTNVPATFFSVTFDGVSSASRRAAGSGNDVSSRVRPLASRLLAPDSCLAARVPV